MGPWLPLPSRAIPSPPSASCPRPAPPCRPSSSSARFLAAVSSTDLAGKRVVLNIFPSLDTGTCAMSVRSFNELAAGLDNTVVVCVSKDLPFAQARFCGAEGLENVVTGSAFRSSFGEDYGVTMAGRPPGRAPVPRGDRHR